MAKLPWYWHRLRAMGPTEIASHLRKKLFQWSDEQALPNWSSTPVRTGDLPVFPQLPSAESAPAILREALQGDVRDILDGRWKAFAHLELKVDDPPLWQADYLAGKDLETEEPAFHLDHRRLPEGADIKLIWELSRWYLLVRLAMAAYVLGDARAARKCIEWLEDWTKHNLPYRGWNWTSALEVGMRLVQFTWIDALLNSFAGRPPPLNPPARETAVVHVGSLPLKEPGAGLMESKELQERLHALRRQILPAHVRYAWRYRSFGSSANNHLLGELTGLILAIARWPELAHWAGSLAGLRKLWEREVLAQFAGDGGHREQALNYHLFSWEFCWQAQAALEQVDRPISSQVEERLRNAANFFVNVQGDGEAWDYGDSDNAFVTPFFLDGKNAAAEWRDWFRYPASSPAIHYWWGQIKSGGLQAPGPRFAPVANGAGVRAGWQIYSESGFAISRSENWTLRWDVSPLGYLSTAAHGHLDALHLSIWFREVAIVIDPGTGAYYVDRGLRTYLASWQAHNGPHPVGSDFPERLGPFLWSAHHSDPDLKPGADTSLSGEVSLPSGLLKRTLIPLSRDEGWQVDDAFHPRAAAGGDEFCVRWQFAPGARLDKLAERKFRISRAGVSIEIEVGGDWAEVRPVIEGNNRPLASAALREPGAEYGGTVAPAFRKIEWSPYLKLTARGHKPCVFRTTFLACGGS